MWYMCVYIVTELFSPCDISQQRYYSSRLYCYSYAIASAKIKRSVGLQCTTSILHAVEYATQ
jgi:hypothetical protein